MITEVQIHVRTVTSGDTTSVNIKENNSGAPGNLVATLMNPATLTSSALNTFTSLANTTLDAGTPYWISMSEGSSNRVTFSSTNGDSETGWSIGNSRLWGASESEAWNSEMASLIVVIKGTATTTTASDDASLSALTVNDGTNDLTLDPTLASGTYVYAAEVGDAVDEVTLTATVNDDGAEVSSVTLGGTAIADIDFTDGITVPSLAGGDNEIVVTVTAEDTTTQTYTVTVTVTRAVADLLASNYLDNGLSINLSLIGDTDTNTNQVSAHKFTTGFAAGGYTLDSVSFHAGSFLGTNINPKVSIYSSGADSNPDSSLFVLTGTVETSGETTLTAPPIPP